MLNVAVFICGAALMVIELTGSRILAPILGTSIIVWTSIIGVVLACLSLGAWVGGRIADNHPRPEVLGRIVILSAWATAAIGLSKTLILSLLHALDTVHGMAIGATIALFAPVSLLLGMVVPFAVRLSLREQAHSGTTSGNLYAISTVGSIVGTFLAGFVLIAWLGSTSILFVTAAALSIAALCVERSQLALKVCSFLVFLLLAVLNKYHDASLSAQGFVDVDTAYNRVLVYNSREGATGRPTREMVTGPHGRQSATYLDDPIELAVPYTRFYRLAEHYQPWMRSMLVLGGGGFSFPKYALATYPEVAIDVVELDAGITNLARSHFYLQDDPRLSIVAQDARVFLTTSKKTYDVILCDVFTSHYSIPFHLVTQEALQQMRERLNPSGVLLINILSSQRGPESDFFAALGRTLNTVFPLVRYFAVHDSSDFHGWQNFMVAAFKEPIEAFPPSGDVTIQNMLAQEIEPPPQRIPILTDEFAPVDRYSGIAKLF
jgi:predicted membrane-bound spermidine synthase